MLNAAKLTDMMDSSTVARPAEPALFDCCWWQRY